MLVRACLLRVAPVLASACLGSLAVGCGDSASAGMPEGGLPSLPSECGAGGRCKEGEGCFERRCVALCATDHDCAPREKCAGEGSASGLCVARDEAPPGDPCAGKLCLAPTPACHPVTGTCVACTGADHCPAEAPVCDRGLGTCVAGASELCAPCNGESDCANADAGAGFSCVASDDPFERACVPADCAGESDCPPGFACSPARKVCLPRRGSCTAYRSALLAISCTGASGCSALGVAAHSVHEGTCAEGTCALGCEQTSDCPGALVCSELACQDPTAAPDAASPSSMTGEGGV